MRCWRAARTKTAFGGATPCSIGSPASGITTRSCCCVWVAGAIFEALWSVVAQIVSSRERMWSLLLFSTLPRDARLVLLAFVFVPRLESTGLALAYGLSRIAGLVLAVAVARQSGSLGPESSPSHGA